MVDRIIHSGGIVVCEEHYLQGMRELQAAADVGRREHRDCGFVVPILPMWPDEQKYSKVKFCTACELIVLARSDQIPPEQIPAIAK